MKKNPNRTKIKLKNLKDGEAYFIDMPKDAFNFLLTTINNHPEETVDFIKKIINDYENDNHKAGDLN